MFNSDLCLQLKLLCSNGLHNIELPGFLKLMKPKSSFLDLRGDSKLAAKLIDGFREGCRRQSILE